MGPKRAMAFVSLSNRCLLPCSCQFFALIVGVPADQRNARDANKCELSAVVRISLHWRCLFCGQLPGALDRAKAESGGLMARRTAASLTNAADFNLSYGEIS